MRIKEYFNKFTFLEKILGLIIIGIILIIGVYLIFEHHQETVRANIEWNTMMRQPEMDAKKKNEESSKKIEGLLDKWEHQDIEREKVRQMQIRNSLELQRQLNDKERR